MAWDDTASKIWFDGNMVGRLERCKHSRTLSCCPLWYKCF